MILTKNKSLKILFVFFAIFMSSYSYGQSMIVKGKVVDEKGFPLIGVTIIEEGINNGAATDFDGNYALNVKSPEASLAISYIGFKTQVIAINGESTVNIIMVEDLESLEEVQVVAFSKQKKNSVIGSISTVKASELKIPSSNLTTAFAGKIAGLISYQRSGEPGADNAEFFIRGVTTFGYKNNPLILLDGLEITTEDLARLEPDNVATFSIMKDATATSLYGARGANGVILVTTKEGKKGKARISFRYENNFSAPSKIPSFLGAVDYMRMYNQAQRMRDQSALLKYSSR
ncbi:MAG: carboxypeptidase-like regulatory domain-containing protein, partial [Flavobacteriaceae bacterium]|nr:carboxypeptidase-like regulatory domain-containing protein [Flavobacteriaceae bacterium]